MQLNCSPVSMPPFPSCSSLLSSDFPPRFLFRLACSHPPSLPFASDGF